MKITVDSVKQERLDLFLTRQLPELTRSRIQNLVKTGDILLNGQTTKPKSPVVSGDLISVNVPEAVPDEAQAEEIELSILFEDEHLIVVNKASGMVVHPAAGNERGTLVNALLHHCEGNLAGIAGVQRPGIVHRLDKDTSGCIIVAKTDLVYQDLVKQFAERSTGKDYLSVVQGSPNKAEDTIFTNIGRHPVNRMKMAVVDPGSGKEAITDYRVLYHDETTKSSLVHCILHTGRTHQIRVHMHHIACPIIGDIIYAKPKRQIPQPGRLMLHARRLCVTHPITKERLEFRAPIPLEYHAWTDCASASILEEL